MRLLCVEVMDHYRVLSINFCRRNLTLYFAPFVTRLVVGSLGRNWHELPVPVLPCILIRSDMRCR